MTERLYAVVCIILLLAGIAAGVYVYVYGNQAAELVKAYPSGNEQTDQALNGKASTTLIRAAKFKGKSKEIVSAQDQNGMTRLHWAASRGHVPMVKLLIAEGAPVDAQDANGTTPLITAAANGQLDIVKMLIANRADTTLQDSAGHTAVYYADENGHKEVADMLRQRGAE
ncbi:MAG TPA: ankyrin repeat domain-containing protein [Armatimonadota bacterium]